MSSRAVYLTGGDSVNSATDDDHRLTQKALAAFCDIVPIGKAEIIHTVNWYSLIQYKPRILKEKYVIAHIPHDVRNMLSRPEFCKIAPFVNTFIVPSTRAKKMFNDFGITCDLVPYSIDTDVFYPIEKDDSRINKIQEKYNIPQDRYLIGSFQRDTEGKDLKTPKYMKGPDIFLNILKIVYHSYKNIHVILCGPRRFWIREQLEKEGIPYTFIGTDIMGRDDLKENTLSQEVINLLYNIIDLYIVSSRIEGGPKAIIEASAAKCKIISTGVGNAEDILTEESIFDSGDTGSVFVLDDIHKGYVQKAVDSNYLKAIQYSPDNISSIWKKIYGSLCIADKPESNICFKEISNKTKFRRTFFLPGRQGIAFIHKFHKPPWGGGNQFLMALKKEFKKRGKRVNSKIEHNTKACLFNSFLFDIERIGAKLHSKHSKDFKVIYRVDGPTYFVRGKDQEIDDKIFAFDEEFADITVFQSYWSLYKTLELGYKPVNPILIPNAVDPETFNNKGKCPFSKDRKTRLISTSWSDNIRKGYDTYKWIEENLDWDKYEYTFVGRIPGTFDKIRLIPPLPSKELAATLKEHDIYITASINDPCSNALLEALACGLPALYLNSGGHSEIVGSGGGGFSSHEEIAPQLQRLVENYEMFQSLIVVPKIEDIADSYLAIIQ